MNPVFYILCALAAILLWFVLSFMFPLIGSLFKALWDDAMFNMKKDHIFNKEEEIKK